MLAGVADAIHLSSVVPFAADIYDKTNDTAESARQTQGGRGGFENALKIQIEKQPSLRIQSSPRCIHRSEGNTLVTCQNFCGCNWARLIMSKGQDDLFIAIDF